MRYLIVYFTLVSPPAGTVTRLSGPRTIDVLFDRHGLKTLHLDYAKLTIL